MKRSVILMGGKTYVLSLPSQWIKRYQIRKGQELDVEEKENAIIIRTDTHPAGKELEIDFSALDRMLGRGIGGIYKAGYTRAKILFETREQLQYIEKTLQETCIGFEIVKQAENYVIVESLSEALAQEFDTSFRRLFYSLELMNQDMVLALASGDPVLLKKVIEKDQKINRLADLCRRVINSGETQFISKAHLLYYLVEQLERIGDLYKKISSFALENTLVVPQEILALFTEVDSFFLSYRELFYAFQLKDYEAFGSTFGSLRKKMISAHGKCSGKLYPLLVYQSILLETIFDMNGALLTIHL